jgi:hypothetical protein
MLQTDAAPSGALDFNRHIPERVRGLARSTAPINWAALELVIRTTEGSELQKMTFGRRFLKAIKKHGVEAMTPWFRYHYCSARLWLGDFSDYWGWECRGLRADEQTEELAARVFWENTWLPKWGGAPLKRLLVIGEQGLGDVLYATSILPECLVRAREVVFECDERLHSLLERSFPRLKCRKDTTFDDPRSDYGPIDAFILSMDLMRMFRRHVSHFPGRPYLKPDPARVAEMEGYRGAIGVAWSARQGSIDPASLGYKRPVSLQYKETHPDIETPPIDLWSDIEGVTALCSVLGKVVTVPTTVHHIAGALGKRTEIIVPERKAGEVISHLRWDYPVGRLPWYANAEVFADVASWKRSCARCEAVRDE